MLVIIPTYNEIETLQTTLQNLWDHVSDVDVLVVDDNSPDGTGKLADELSAADPRIHVMHRTGKLGLGTAYLAGFAWGIARGYSHVVEMDADGSHRPEDFTALRNRAVMGGFDLVIGSRWVPGGEVENWPKHREVLSRGANLYTRAMLGFKVRDATAGYRIYRSDLLQRLDLEAVSSHGYCFQVDMTWRTLQAGGTVSEVPIIFVERRDGESKMSKNIIFEALINVTKWGIGHRLRQITGRSRPRSAAAAGAGPAESSDSPGPSSHQQ